MRNIFKNNTKKAIPALLLLFLSSSIFAGGGSSENEAKHIYTPGEWGFSSDHLPIGAKIQLGQDSVRIASFNVLNENFKKSIKAGQKLEGSTLDQLSEDERNKENLNIIIYSMNHDKVGIFCLQEVNSKFFNLLSNALDSTQYAIKRAQSGTKDDYGLIIYDKTRFEENTTQEDWEKIEAYSGKEGKKNKYIHDLSLIHKKGHEIFHFINTHAEFQEGDHLAQYLNRVNGPVVAMGDLNLGFHTKTPKTHIEHDLMQQLPHYHLLKDHSTYTHVSTDQNLDVFDHILYKDLTILPDPELVQSMRKTFTLKNRN